MSIKFVHTNIICQDWKKLAEFYVQVFDCQYIYPERNLFGQDFEKGIGLQNAQLTGIHLRLPGYGDSGPTLELHQYSQNIKSQQQNLPNIVGFRHIAFQTQNVQLLQQKVLKFGGKSLGKITTLDIKNVGEITYVYMQDPEDNIIELQQIKKKKMINSDLLNQPVIPKIPQTSLVENFAQISKMGTKKDQQMNQDSYFCLPKFNSSNKKALFGVFDGHGPNGHYVSQFVRDNLHENIQKFLNLKENDDLDSRQGLSKAFDKTNKELFKSTIDIQLSGSTAIVVYIKNNTLFCANLGDSKAVLFKNNNKGWQVQLLSLEHKPDNVMEQARIERMGGIVAPNENDPSGPQRLWLKHLKAPGLALSRCFGDFLGTECGIIAEPEIISFNIGDEDKILVLGSDGLFEFMADQHIMEVTTPFYLNQQQDPEACQKAAEELVRLSYIEWTKQDKYIDDITVLVIFLKSQKSGIIDNQQMAYSQINQEQMQQNNIPQYQQENNQSQQYVPQNADLQRQLQQKQQQQQFRNQQDNSQSPERSPYNNNYF